jgi:hypothetical protein
MEAVSLRQVDMDYRNHLQAWLSFSAQATKKKGQPVYSKFKKFYDYEKKLRDASKKEAKKSRFSGIGKLLNKGG